MDVAESCSGSLVNGRILEIITVYILSPFDVYSKWHGVLAVYLIEIRQRFIA